MSKQLYIWFVNADIHWPVGNAGAIVIAEDKKIASNLTADLGLLNSREPVKIGVAVKGQKEGVLFYNIADY